MDSQDEVWNLLDYVKSSAPREHRLGWALRLEDILRDPHEMTFISYVLEHLVEIVLPMESDVSVSNALFDAVSRAMSANPSVDVSLDPLMHYLSDEDPAYIANVLILILKSRARSYKPVVERYRTHDNPIVRQNAEYAWKYVYQQTED